MVTCLFGTGPEIIRLSGQYVTLDEHVNQVIIHTG